MLQRKSIEISMDLIHPNPEQPRKNFSEEELEDLKNSIAEYGVLQPVIVKKCQDNGYFLIAGERRFRAARLAGLSKIPALIKDFSDRDAAVIAVVENVQREDLSFIEEAWAYKKLLDEYGLTQGELASKIGKKQSTISNKLRILTLPQDILDKLTDENLTERHGRALLKIEDKEAREKILNRVIANQLNVKQTEKLIEDYLTKENLEKRKKNKVNYISYKIYMNTIYKTFRQIKELEEGVVYQQEDKGEFVEVKIVIPKNKGCFT